MAEKQRIDKLVASSGKYTRSEVKKLIRAGLVLVDGIAVRSGDEKADPETVEIRVKGEVLIRRGFFPPQRTGGRKPCWICCRRSCSGRSCSLWGGWIRTPRACCC